MKPNRRVRYAALIAGLLASAAVLPTRQASAAEQWGEVHFPVSCQAGVQQVFDQAVAMVHSFSFGDALRAHGVCAVLGNQFESRLHNLLLARCRRPAVVQHCRARV